MLKINAGDAKVAGLPRCIRLGGRFECMDRPQSEGLDLRVAQKIGHDLGKHFAV
jgi:hypothetical protein